MKEVVWLSELRRFAFLVSRGAFYSTVYIPKDTGKDDTIVVENDDYELWEERAIEYESDERG